MQSPVTDKQIERYQRDGVVVLRGLLDNECLEQLALGIEQNLHEPSARTTHYVGDGNSRARFFYDARAVGEVEAYDRLMLRSPMAEAVARLMLSTQSIAFYISVFVRTAGIRNRTPWHQDQPSWSASGEQACSAWLSLDPVSHDTALEFVRGSHRWQTRYQRSEFFQYLYEDDDRSRDPQFPDIQANRADFDIVSWELQPGDCVVFHGMTAHGGSGDLPPGLGRRAVSVQWLGDDARYRIVPGGDDPKIGVELEKRGIRPGESPVCDMCPVAYRASA